jgi:hypothetical protein
MNLNTKHVLAGLATTGVLAGAVAGGGVAFASAGSARTPAATAAATAAQPAPGWCYGGPGGMHGVWSGQQPVVTAAADYLGVSQSQLLSQLQSGKSLADVAKTQGKSVSGLKDAILAAMTSRINASARLSAAQKAAMISEVKSHLDAIVNGTYPSGTGMHWMHSPMRDAGSPAGWMYGV